MPGADYLAQEILGILSRASEMAASIYSFLCAEQCPPKNHPSPQTRSAQKAPHAHSPQTTTADGATRPHPTGRPVRCYLCRLLHTRLTTYCQEPRGVHADITSKEHAPEPGLQEESLQSRTHPRICPFPQCRAQKGFCPLPSPKAKLQEGHLQEKKAPRSLLPGNTMHFSTYLSPQQMLWCILSSQSQPL